MKNFIASPKALPILAIIAVSLIGFDNHRANAFTISANGALKSRYQPVHEMITEKAAIDSQLITDPNSLEMKYLVEGSRFNDDPEGYLLEGAMVAGQGGVFAYAKEFIGFNKQSAVNDPTKATHFGAYQFLHAMGDVNSTAEQIKEKIILYAAHCWNMATAENSFENFKSDYNILANQAKNPDANFHATRDQIIIRKAIELFPKEILLFHSTNQLQFRYRALGSLLHVIQDSYSKAHVVRTDWEHENGGKIQYFQDYSKQDAHVHETHDNSQSGQLTSNNLFEIEGARSAYLRSKEILSMVKNDCPWTRGQSGASTTCNNSVYGFLDSEVFDFDDTLPLNLRGTRSHPELVPKATDGNSSFTGGS